MLFTRRRMLIGGALAPCLGSFSACNQPIRPMCPNDPAWTNPGPPLVIDTHTHVFNASDLQVKQFVKQVASRQASGGWARLAKYFGGFLQHLTWSVAPDSKSELRRLEDIADVIRNCTSAHLSGEVARLRDTQYQRAVGEMQSTASQIRTMRRLPALNRTVPWASASDAEKGLRSIEDLPATFDQFSARRAARAAAREPDMTRVSVDSAVAFMLWMFQYRYVSVFEHLQTYNSPERKVDLLVASLVDYDWWLAEGRSTPSVLRDQADLMSAISVLTAGRVHAFMPFCPFREAQYRAAPGSTFSSLEFVRNSVESQGALGVKLYPPMGFAPLGNTGKRLWRSPPLPPLAAREDFGELLDKALRDLYSWCQSDGVPIMAHSNPSNGPSDEFEELAGPRYWQLALAEFPRLRVSFGHFGAVMARENRRPNAKAFVALMTDEDGRAGSHAYADASYFSELLDQPALLEDALVGLFESDAEAKRVLASRVLFGSDWKMLLLEDGAARYLANWDPVLDNVTRRLAPVGDYSQLKSSFIGENAASYLGLEPGGQARERLMAFYRAKEMTVVPSWAQKLNRRLTSSRP